MEKYNQLLDACANNDVRSVMHNANIPEHEALSLIGHIHDNECFHNNLMFILMNDVAEKHNGCNPTDKWLPIYPVWLQERMERIPPQSYVCDHEVVPLTSSCKFRKLSNRASQFVMSLGKPEIGIVSDYRKHLQESVSVSPVVTWNGIEQHVYEEFVAVPMNGKYEFFYVAVANGNVFYVHKKAPGHGKNAWKFGHLDSDKVCRDGQALTYDEKYYKENGEGETTFFDVEGFLANLWVAETTSTCEPLDEPMYTRNEFNSVSKLRGHAPLSPSSAYRYIHITDSVWQKYEHANEQVRSNSNYHVPSWFVRAHYAKRHEKYVLIKGHYAYRKCAGVDYQEPIDYIV